MIALAVVLTLAAVAALVAISLLYLYAEVAPTDEDDDL